MTNDRRQTIQDVLIFALLVAIGVAGRWGRPEWGFTPVGAASVFAGYYFSRWGIAAMVPLAILGISDLAEPAYNSLPVMILTYAAMLVPVWLGRSAANGTNRASSATRWILCGIVPATVFWLVSNFGVWAFQSDYTKTLAGLMECYWAAVPFYRSMLAGDIFYVALLGACWAAAGMPGRVARVEGEVR